MKKTRFGSKPSHQDTFKNIGTFEGCGQFMSEKDKFDVRFKREVDVVENDKNLKILIKSRRIKSITKSNDFFKERIDIHDFIKEHKEKYSLLQRTKNIHAYELVKY